MPPGLLAQARDKVLAFVAESICPGSQKDFFPAICAPGAPNGFPSWRAEAGSPRIAVPERTAAPENMQVVVVGSKITSNCGFKTHGSTIKQTMQ
ncbi:hypothetical protein PAPYR_5485 [Paratrimastix pyriformis]|uniref:Uncharacterized protein n=1 Tax=Paratrimastix pyriformis TaxID=342808 RepID=A0ABQ8UN17_9EUKA|nr:hypothetical protein PAPYR_5485 [Paratrimastix pyriformis]